MEIDTAKQQFDIIIVGAGIHGATIALEAAKAGYRIILFDKGDFCSATSANSLKIIHGGIRYIQHGDFKRMRESIRSRRSMMKFAPHLVDPLPCVMPTKGYGLRSRLMMRAAFAFYDIISCDRNKGIAKEYTLSNSTSLNRAQFFEVTSEVDKDKQQNITGGAVWFDALANNTERLTIEYILEARRYGAVISNYSEVTRFLIENNIVRGVTVKKENGEKEDVFAPLVINSTGAWIEEIGKSEFFVNQQEQQWASALNIVVNKPLFKKYAVGLEGHLNYRDHDAIIQRGKRLFFFVPWQKKYTMIGTNYTPFKGSPDEFTVKRDELEKFLQEINQIYPSGKLQYNNISFYHGGLLPMQALDNDHDDAVQLEKSSKILDHLVEDGISGAITVSGIKYTTAPEIAKEALHIIQAKLGSPKNKSEYESSIPSHENHILNDTIKKHLQKNYGRHWLLPLAHIVQKKENAEWICQDPPLLYGEIYYFIYHEMAKHLTDIVFRRCNLATATCPEQHILETIAVTMAAELNWSEEKSKKEVQEVLDYFSCLKVL